MAPSGEPSPIDGRYFSGSAVLELDRGAWTFVSRDLRLTGAAEFSKGRLVLGGEATCPERGTYAWTAAGRGFTLEAEEDPCPGRPVLLSKRWVPIASSTDRLRNGDHMVLSDLWFGTYRGERDVSEDERFEIEVLATVGAKGSFYFSPSILVGRPGQVLTLTVLNPDRRGVIPLPHSLVIDALGLDTGLLRPGDEATVTVTFPQEGALTFYCFYHAEDGQAGELRVAA
jgi:plastocyanin